MRYLEDIINYDNMIDNINQKREELYDLKINTAQNIFNKCSKKLKNMNLQIRTKTQFLPFISENDCDIICFNFQTKYSNGNIYIDVKNEGKTIKTQGELTKSEIDEAMRIVNKILKEG